MRAMRTPQIHTITPPSATEPSFGEKRHKFTVGDSVYIAHSPWYTGYWEVRGYPEPLVCEAILSGKIVAIEHDVAIVTTSVGQVLFYTQSRREIEAAGLPAAGYVAPREWWVE